MMIGTAGPCATSERNEQGHASVSSMHRGARPCDRAGLKCMARRRNVDAELRAAAPACGGSSCCWIRYDRATTATSPTSKTCRATRPASRPMETRAQSECTYCAGRRLWGSGRSRTCPRRTRASRVAWAKGARPVSRLPRSARLYKINTHELPARSLNACPQLCPRRSPRVQQRASFAAR